MTTLNHEIYANCDPERVWAVLSDLESVAHYNPTVRSANVLGPQTTGVGAKRSCSLIPKGTVVERVTHWQPGAQLGLEVAESDWPVHFMRWVTRVEAAEGRTRITQTLSYKVKFGPLGWLLDALVMKPKLRATLDSVFLGLVKFAEGSTEPGARAQAGTLDARAS